MYRLALADGTVASVDMFCYDYWKYYYYVWTIGITIDILFRNISLEIFHVLYLKSLIHILVIICIFNKIQPASLDMFCYDYWKYYYYVWTIGITIGIIIFIVIFTRLFRRKLQYINAIEKELQILKSKNIQTIHPITP